MNEELILEEKIETEREKKILQFKQRMLAWDSPVEYVNNMYGCHPNDDNEEYFKVVFRDQE